MALLWWTLYAFPPNSVVRVRISWVDNAYDLAFTVMADDQGMFRGSFRVDCGGRRLHHRCTGDALHTSAEIANTR